ncbi:MAG: hypothetical protein V4808_11605 [Pseudomonadota bacterium]
MKLYAAALAAMISIPASAQVAAPEIPATFKLHPVYMKNGETALVDVASLRRSGDIVWGWNLNVFLKPKEVATGYTTDAQWTRFIMFCASNSAMMTWFVGRSASRTTFKVLINQKFAIWEGSGWDLIRTYACKGGKLFNEAPYINEATAIAAAKAEMVTGP